MAILPEEACTITSSADEERESSDEKVDNCNEGWADAMSKVLGRLGSKDVSSVILAKSKLDKNEEDDVEAKVVRRKRSEKKREWENMNYVKPNVLERDYERALQKTATRGVIQLFNAVKTHQSQMDQKLKAASTESKRDKVYKNVSKGKFLDMLDGGKGNARKHSKNEDEKDAPAWKVLRDDFMMGNDMKDWDKDADDEEKTPVKPKKSKKSRT